MTRENETPKSNTEKVTPPSSTFSEAASSSAKPSSPSDFLTVIILGAILGMVGQGIRVLVGLKKVYDEAVKIQKPVDDLLEYKQLALSLFIGLSVGAIAGVLAAVNNIGGDITKSVIISFIASGYAGTDFIEGFIKKYPMTK
jgi:hypothetical protein